MLWQCLAPAVPSASNYILVVRRSGVIEFIEPTTLKTAGSLTIEGVRKGAGLNGIASDPDGRTIYLEGPVKDNSTESDGCCWLYSIDLATLKTKVAAGIWGSGSRRNLINVGPGLLQHLSESDREATNMAREDKWQASPDGRWWFGLRNGPAVDLYDASEQKIVRSFAASHSDAFAWASGTWSGDRFYVYGHWHKSARFWTLSSDSTRLGAGFDVPGMANSSACGSEALFGLVAAGDRILLYEIFGSKIDRRDRCASIPGGVWTVNPETGGVVSKMVPSLHFWNVSVNKDASEFYGITSEAPGRQAPAKLVRVDAKTGNVLQQRMLESDYWWLTTASLQVTPPRATLVTLTPQSIP